MPGQAGAGSASARASDVGGRQAQLDGHVAPFGDRTDAGTMSGDDFVGSATRAASLSRRIRSSRGRGARRRAGRGDRSRARSGWRSRAWSRRRRPCELSVSAGSLIEVSGVRSSWLMLATKSRRTRSMRRRTVMSCNDMTSPPSSSGTTSTANCWSRVAQVGLASRGLAARDPCRATRPATRIRRRQ